MGLMSCGECGKQISTKAAACPHCGYVRKRRRGFLFYVGWGFLLLVGSCTTLAILGHNMRDQAGTTAVQPVGPSATKTASDKPYIEGATVSVGYTSYAVRRSWWSYKLSTNQFIDERPNARYLFVELTVRNDDNKARIVPPLKLVDANGAEYSTDSRGEMADNAISILEQLNPGVSKQGVIVFDAPPGLNYRLKLDGGYWSTESAFVQLEPK